VSDSKDWDKQMAEIDRAIAKGGGAPPSGPPARVAAGAPAPMSGGGGSAAVTTRRRDLAAVWSRAALGTAGAAALPFWPYSKTCGTLLYVYLIGGAAVAAAGVWTMRGAWTHRRGVASAVGVLILMAGLGLVAFEVLRHTSLFAHPLSWTCP
jgi:hypothetical protein